MRKWQITMVAWILPNCIFLEQSSAFTLAMLGFWGGMDPMTIRTLQPIINRV